MGVGRADEVHVPHAVPAHVVEERALALDEPPVLLARDRLPDEALLERLGRLLGDGRRHRLASGRDDGLDDVHVPRAAADVPLQRDAHVLLGRVRVPREQGGGAHQHPGRAVAALERVVLVERLLERRQLTVGGEPLDRRDLGALGLHREHHAALHRLAVDVDGAGAAVARVAADVRPGETEVVAEEVDEEPARRHLELDLLAVDLDRDGAARHRLGHYFLLRRRLQHGARRRRPRRGGDGSRPSRGRPTADRARRRGPAAAARTASSE